VAIRGAVAGDARRVVEVYVESWNVGFVGLMPPIALDDGRVERWAGELSGGPARWWVAEYGGVIVGLVGIGPSRDPVDPGLGELDTIAVDPAHWRTGVGRALMRTAIEGLTDDGYPEAILWTLAKYAQGQRFYESTGWHADGNTRDDGRQVSFRRSLKQAR
jgi:GNAT superfamily N-acetyltransferase